MDSFALKIATPSENKLDHSRLLKLSTMAPRPRNMEETGLSRNYLEELVIKHLYDAGVVGTAEISKRTALAGPVIEEVLTLLREDARVEIRGSSADTGALRYAITDRGRLLALEALNRSGYLGVAPVPLKEYVKIVNAQSVYDNTVTRDQMHAAFSDIVMEESLLDEVGAAMNSGRATFVYGPAGSGKTYTCQRLARIMGEPVLIPYAVAVDDSTIQLFDPVIHQPKEDGKSSSGLLLEQGYDPRFQLCERPAVITGGELTLDMLEISFDRTTGLQQAPLQMKAMNGIYMIDDLGRQKVDVADLFNRWIVPLEVKQDYLTLASGKRFPIPFDVTLIFSTNLDPSELADDAFLRRIGHKIQFTYLTHDQYETIWKMICNERGIQFDPDLLRFTQSMHEAKKVRMLPCHPRDLLGMALDQFKYLGTQDNRISVEMMTTAWNNYFVNHDGYWNKRSTDAANARAPKD